MKKRILPLFITLLMFSVIFSVSAFASDLAAGTVKTAGGRLNVRKSASSSSQVITSIANKKAVAIYGKSGSWYKVEYADGKYGYSHSDYITPRFSAFRAYVNTPGSVLNVRKGNNTSYAIKDTLSHGTSVTVISVGSTFSKIIYEGTKIGYVSSAYLQRTPESFRKISLSVPSYKQTDSRWKNVTIGSQGGTIGTIGCTTTALAMTESHRLGSTVTPTNMRNQLTYTASGSLYWPENYYTELVTSANHLSRIYSVLSSGKPVIFGAKSTGGKQHWVVVTGHTSNTTSLSAANFTINDPGSNTRTTLKAFLSAYQNPYKIAYYK